MYTYIYILHNQEIPMKMTTANRLRQFSQYSGIKQQIWKVVS